MIEQSRSFENRGHCVRRDHLMPVEREDLALFVGMSARECWPAGVALAAIVAGLLVLWAVLA